MAVDVGGRTVVSVAHERISRKPGSDLALNVDAANLHIFDSDSQTALAHGGALA